MSVCVLLRWTTRSPRTEQPRSTKEGCPFAPPQSQRRGWHFLLLNLRFGDTFQSLSVKVNHQSTHKTEKCGKTEIFIQIYVPIFNSCPCFGETPTFQTNVRGFILKESFIYLFFQTRPLLSLRLLVFSWAANWSFFYSKHSWLQPRRFCPWRDASCIFLLWLKSSSSEEVMPLSGWAARGTKTNCCHLIRDANPASLYFEVENTWIYQTFVFQSRPFVTPFNSE